MKKIILLSVILLVCGFIGFAQQIPLGSRGIVYIYDAAGNRTKRLYYCNNGGPYPTRTSKDSIKNMNVEVLTKTEINHMEFQEVDALYPNPTSGIFYITFSKPVSNATIAILDANGKIVQQFKATGYKLTCNLFGNPAGVYFIKIKNGELQVTKKIIKQ